MNTIESEMHAFYGEGKELDRLARGIGPLELARTQELMAQSVPAPPAAILDIGGAHGTYSFWLASLGYEVHLVDSVPLHIDEARRAAAKPGSPQLAGIEVGDARSLTFADGSADVVVLHGPLYHLTEHADRLAALSEAHRVLRPGGLLLAFTITSYASLIVGITKGWVVDDDYLTMCEGEIATGFHRRPESWPSLFSSGYFHHPRRLADELSEARFRCEDVLGVEGPGWMIPDFEECWRDDERRSTILRVARHAGCEPILSPHNMAVARKQ